MAWTDIPTRTSSDLNAAADVNALMDNCDFLLDQRYPINSFYWQAPSAEDNDKATAFPTADEPGELFGGTWEQYYDDEGIGFKTEGDVLSQTDGENNNRTTGLQTDAMQGHYHTESVPTVEGAGNVRIRGTTGTGNQATGTQSVLEPKTDGTNGTPRTGKETRGRNRLFKLWRRTA